MTDKTTEQQQAEAANLPSVSKAELDEAKKQGVLEAAKEAAKANYKYADALPDEGTGQKWPGKSETMQYAHILDLGPDAFKDRVKEGGDNQLPEQKVAGLLELERSGKNRTEYVKALMDRLGVDSPYEVTKAGPSYTNDVTPVTAL